jgi:hypothetical protein
LIHGRNLTKSSTDSGEMIAVDSVYTETELRYYVELLRKIAMKKYGNDAIMEYQTRKELDSHNVKS